jgi:hypothetical protein
MGKTTDPKRGRVTSPAANGPAPATRSTARKAQQAATDRVPGEDYVDPPNNSPQTNRQTKKAKAAAAKTKLAERLDAAVSSLGGGKGVTTAQKLPLLSTACSTPRRCQQARPVQSPFHMHALAIYVTFLPCLWPTTYHST